ncbi:MAG: sporulation protein YunB [Ruminococcus sp.]|nr:sporulation protein YunB [Ruminococcus sp.]
MSLNRRSKKGRISCILITSAAVLLTLVVWVSVRLDRYAAAVCETDCREYARRVMSSSVRESMEELEGVSLYTTEGGTVAADYREINILKADILERVDRQLGSVKAFSETTLGALLGVTVLNWLGPEIPIDIEQTAAASGEVVTELCSVGINETLLRVRLRLTVELRAMTAGKLCPVTVTDEYVLCEVLISGDVPAFYAGGE